MPWCPICKNEYREGYTHCNDCDIDLVESLDQGPVKIMYGMKEQIEQFDTYLKENDFLDSFVRYNPDQKSHDLYVPGPKAGQASAIIRQLIALQNQEREEELRELAEQQYRAQLGEDVELDEDEIKELMRQKTSQTFARPRRGQVKKETVYVDKMHRAEEYKSSAYSLILVGVAGIVLLVLIHMGVLPVHFAGAAKVMITVVMGGMFVAFFVMGFLSFGSYKRYLVVAKEEENLIEEINAYLSEHADKNHIDAMVKAKGAEIQASSSEEIDEEGAGAYYIRMRMIKAVLDEKYADEDSLLIDHLAEEWYGKVFEE